MKFLAAIFLVFTFCGCTSVRILSDQERDQHGLNGIIYDARLCPGKFDPQGKELEFNRPCEIVNCGPKKNKIICEARPEEK
ncbi:MAG: hypothetical protein AB7K68_01365 [Bacteriovoracia bacterium]